MKAAELRQKDVAGLQTEVKALQRAHATVEQHVHAALDAP